MMLVNFHQVSKNIVLINQQTRQYTIFNAPTTSGRSVNTPLTFLSASLFVIFRFFSPSAGCHYSFLYLAVPILHSSMLHSSSECYGSLIFTLRREEKGKSAQQLFLIRHLLGSDGTVIKGLVMFGYTC